MTPAQLAVDPERKIGAIDRRLFGAFVEHLGRSVYDGCTSRGTRSPMPTASGATSSSSSGASG